MKLLFDFDVQDLNTHHIAIRIIKLAQMLAPSFHPPQRFNSIRPLFDKDGKFENIELYWDEEEALSYSTIEQKIVNEVKES